MPNFLSLHILGLFMHLREEEGQGLAEYSLVLTFIAVVAIVAVTFIGRDISSLIRQLASGL